MEYEVLIINSETLEIDRQFEKQAYRQACKLEDGININLDHDRYYTSIRKVDETIREL